MNFYFLALFKYILTSDPGLGTSKQVVETDDVITVNPPFSNISEWTETVVCSFDLTLLSDLDHSSSTITCPSPLSYYDEDEFPMEIQDEISCAKDEDSSKDENVEQSHSSSHTDSCLYYVNKETYKDRTVGHKSSNVLADERSLHEKNILENIEKSRTLCGEGDEYFIDKRFNGIGNLGSGSYGEVCLFRTADLNIYCAIKCTDRRNPYSSILDEMKICEVLKNVNHQNIIKVYGMIPHDNLVYIFMEYVSGQSLFYYVKNNFKNITERYRRNIMLQLLNGIEYLLSLNIIHGDLSTSNILVDEKGILKIIDFGFSKVLSKGKMLRTSPVHANYLAPGRIKGLYRRSDDLWSFAIAMYFIYHFKFPFTDDEFSLISHGGQPILKFDENIPVDAKDLMDKMLQIPVEKRLGCNDVDDIEVIRKHSYFENMKKFEHSAANFIP